MFSRFISIFRSNIYISAWLFRNLVYLCKFRCVSIPDPHYMNFHDEQNNVLSNTDFQDDESTGSIT